MSVIVWPDKPKVDEISLTDQLMRFISDSVTKNQLISIKDLLAFLQGSATKLIASEADLPVTANGFHTLEQDKNYIFTEPGSFSDPVLIPAGYIGSISSTFLSENGIDYTGVTNPFISTLNINGTILATATANGGLAITITASAVHGLVDGQFVNITGTSNYNQQRLVISNVFPTTFDVQIPFVGNQSGSFDTGFDILNITNITITNANISKLIELTASEFATSVLIIDNLRTTGFAELGFIKNTFGVSIFRSLFTFEDIGLTIEDCDTVDIDTSFMTALSTNATLIALTIQGVLTTDVGLNNNMFTMLDNDQRPVRIDPSIDALTSIVIQNSPDNLVADEYYDTLSSGLDQTDPRVTALNNGTRANSQSLAEARSDGILEVDGIGGTSVPIVDITPASGDWIEDPTTEEFSVDPTTGLVTYNGIKPIAVNIQYSLSAAQSSGSPQDLIFDLRINGASQSKAELTLTTDGVDNFLPIVYNGGNFNINPSDTFQLFKVNITNTNNTDVENTTMLITRI